MNLLFPLHLNYARLISSHFIGTETEAHRSSAIWPMLSSSTLSPTWFYLKPEEWNIDLHILFLSTAFQERVLTYGGSPLLMLLLHPSTADAPVFLARPWTPGDYVWLPFWISEATIGGLQCYMSKEWKWMNDLMNACVLAHLSTRKQRTRKGQEFVKLYS